jgi:hypothetical protein
VDSGDCSGLWSETEQTLFNPCDCVFCRTHFRRLASEENDGPSLPPDWGHFLVSANPDLLIAGLGTLAATAAMAATKTIPVILASVGDPVGAGLVASLAQPGANVAGLTSQATRHCY